MTTTNTSTSTLGIKFLDICYTNSANLIAIYNIIILGAIVTSLSGGISPIVRLILSTIYLLIFAQWYVPIMMDPESYTKEDKLNMRIGMYVASSASIVISFILSKFIFVLQQSSIIAINTVIFAIPLVITAIQHDLENKELEKKQ